MHSGSSWISTGPTRCRGCRPADSAEALRRGLVRIDSQGRADGPAYNPLHPEVREAMKQRVTKALDQLKAVEPGGAGGGLVIRLGPGPTLAGNARYRARRRDLPEVHSRYLRAGGDPRHPRRREHRTRPIRGAIAIRGGGRADALAHVAIERDRHALCRAEHRRAGGCPRGPARGGHAGPGRRSGRQRGAASRSGGPCRPASRGEASGSIYKPGRAVPARRWYCGERPSRAKCSRTIWPPARISTRWSPRGRIAACCSRSAEKGPRARRRSSPAALAAERTSPRTSVPGSSSPNRMNRQAAPGCRRPGHLRRGPTPRIWLTALPLGDGPAADEPLGHALAALDARWVFLAEKAVSGQEERLRRFARVLGALPAKDGAG